MSLTFTAVSSEHAAAILAGAPIVVESEQPSPYAPITMDDWQTPTGGSIWLDHPNDSSFKSRAARESAAHVKAPIGMQSGTYWKSTQTHDGMTVWWWGGIHPVDFVAGWTATGGRPERVDRWGRPSGPPADYVSATKPCPECDGEGKIYCDGCGGHLCPNPACADSNCPNPHFCPDDCDGSTPTCPSCGGDGQQRIDVAVRCECSDETQICNPFCEDCTSGLTVVGSVRAVEVLPIHDRMTGKWSRMSSGSRWIVVGPSGLDVQEGRGRADRVRLMWLSESGALHADELQPHLFAFYGSPSTLVGRWAILTADARPA